MTAPLLGELIRKGIDYRLDSVHTAIPARVESYDSSVQKVTVQPLIKVSYLDEDGNTQVEALPIVADVPVVFPGSGGWRVTFPITAGDTGLLIFAEAVIDKWLTRGGLVDPEDFAHLDNLAEGIFIPGLRSFASPVSDASDDSMLIGNDAGVGIKITGSEVQAGGTAALALKSELDTLKSAIAGAAVLAGDGGAVLKSNILGALTTWPTGTTTLKGS